MKFESTIRGNTSLIELDIEQGKALSDDAETSYSFEKSADDRYILRTGSRSYILDNVKVEQDQIEFTLNGKWIQASIKDEQMLLLDSLGFKVGSAQGEGSVKAPMPGKILNILVSEGDEIEAGSPVVILEAMKMENELKAPVAGKISSISVSVGQSVEKNNVLLEIEPVG